MSSPTFWSFVAFAIGISAYLINFYTIRWPSLLYQATVWLKPLGIFVAVALVNQRWSMPRLSLHTALLLSGLLGWGAFRLSREPPGIGYLQIFRWGEAETYRLGTWIHENLPDTVLIAVPPTGDGEKIQFFARRSAYLWMGEIFHTNQPALYAQRVRQLYGADPMNGRSAWRTLVQEGERYFEDLCERHPDSLRAWGITHIVISTRWCLPYPCLWRGEKYALYAVQKPPATFSEKHPQSTQTAAAR